MRSDDGGFMEKQTPQSERAFSPDRPQVDFGTDKTTSAMFCGGNVAGLWRQKGSLRRSPCAPA